VFLVDTKELGNGGCGLDAHPPGVKITRALPWIIGLDVALRYPRSMDKDYNLVVLHTVVRLVCAAIFKQT